MLEQVMDSTRFALSASWTKKSHLKSILKGVLFGSALILSGCNNDDSLNNPKAYAPIPNETLALMREKGTTPEAPILIRSYKKESEVEVWKMKPDGHYVYLKTFPICRWSGQLGPKTIEGDRQVPEGFYTITPGQMNPHSNYYLSFNVGYPNAYDRVYGRKGGNIMVHGVCSSAGCFSMTDKQMAEIYAITREAFAGGQHSIQMQSLPFRMNAENMAKYRLDPNISFWKQLKEGSDHFEATMREPKVAVCSRRYVFDAQASNGQGIEADGVCPPLHLDPTIQAAVAEKQRKDDVEIAELVSKGQKPVHTIYADGGQNPTFKGISMEVSRLDALAQEPVDVVIEENGRTKGSPLIQQSAIRTASNLSAEESESCCGSTQPKFRATIGETHIAVPVTPRASNSLPLPAMVQQESDNKPFYASWLGLGGEDKSTSTLAEQQASEGSANFAGVPVPPKRVINLNNGKALPKIVIEDRKSVPASAASLTTN